MNKTPVRFYIIITVLVTLWCTGIFLAPVMKITNHNHSADVLYSFFSRICHQNDMCSFHVEGEKLGVCIRCSAVYFGFLAGVLFMLLSGVFRRVYIPNSTLLFAIILPMVIDVVLNVTGLHASTMMTRMVTGALFGVAIPWWVVPLFIEAYLQLIRQKKIHSPDSGVCTYARETQ